jgi:putative DNA primase/helicase
MPTKFMPKKDGIYADRMVGKDENGDPAYESTFICGPLQVVANVRDSRTDAHYRVLRFVTLRGDRKEVLVPDRLIGERELVPTLRDVGLKVGTDPWCIAKVREYVNESSMTRCCRLVQKIGWHSAEEYALPDHIFGMPRHGYYEPAYITPGSDHPFRQAGDLMLWREEVGRKCVGNNRLIMAACMGFAGSLLKPSGENYIGVHLIGGSSKGKSTAEVVGGSVCGGGGQYGFLKQWRSTDNALEGIAEQHNDNLLILDELRQASSKAISEIIYMLGNSQGKSRMNADCTIRRTFTFRVALLSSGEESLEARMNAEGNERKRGGQDVRFIEIPADAGAGFGLFQDLHGFPDGGEFSRNLWDAATKYYGTPLRAFLHQLTDGALTRDVRQLVDECHKSLLKDAPGHNEEVGRVGRKFAVLAVAGELATKWNITGWKEGNAEQAIREIFTLWRVQRGHRSGDVESGMRQVREFFHRFLRSRFDWPEYNANDSVGFIVRADAVSGDRITRICVDPGLFKSVVCKGVDHITILKAFLAEKTLEASTETDRYTIKEMSPRRNKRINVYAFLPSVLEGCKDE